MWYMYVCIHICMNYPSSLFYLYLSFLFIPLIKIINIDMDLKLIANSQFCLLVGARNAQWSLVMTWSKTVKQLLPFPVSPGLPISLLTSDRPIHWVPQGLKKSRIVSHALDPRRKPTFFTIDISLALVPFRDETKLVCENTEAKRANWRGSAVLSPHAGVKEADTKHTSLPLNA